MSRSVTVFLLIFCCFRCAFAAEEELRSLLEFRKGIKSDPLGKILASWNLTLLSDLSSCPDMFYGVVCDSASGSVSAIALDRLGLAGDLRFSTLTGLKHLRNLSLSGNSFTGRVVPAIGYMTSLQYLDLSGNQFYGPVPARLNDLWGLNYLNLSSNNFSGGFPSGIWNLQQLRVLDLHSNRLWGDVQELFSQLRNVEHLDLSHNSFYGSLSMSQDHLSSFANTLHYMNLSHNKLAGGFFTEESMQMFRNLQVLDLGNNGLMGQLPSFTSLPNLKVLRLAHNQLYGSIPEELLHGWVSLEELDLSGNGFSGSVEKVNSTTLRALNLSSNFLSGSLPSSIGNCLMVDLSSNEFSGNISVIQSWEASLEFVDLSSNKLSGTLPNLTSQFQQLTFLSIRNNSLRGALPSTLMTFPRLAMLDLSVNELEGQIPYFASSTLINLNLSGNHLTGSIPLEGMHTTELQVRLSYPQMESLDLSSNSLTGILPPEISNLGRLKLLNLGENQLSGELPSELSKLHGLEYLDFSNNDFKGRIPENLSSNLRVFIVSYNDLSGTVPENLRTFPYTSFHPGNSLLIVPSNMPSGSPPGISGSVHGVGQNHSSKSNVRVAVIVASIGFSVMVAFILFAYARTRPQNFRSRSAFSNQSPSRDVRLGIFNRPSLLKFRSSSEQAPTSRSLLGKTESSTLDTHPATTSGQRLSPGSPIASSPSFIHASIEQPARLDVYSPDRLAGEMFFMDGSLTFTAEELARAPAEVLGRSNHGTLYKATLDNGVVLTVKWLRVGLVKNKKEFAREVKKIGSVRHPNAVPLRAYYWGPREQERLILADYIPGDSLALHLYETTPRRNSPLSFHQRLKVGVEVARCLAYLHESGLPHGNLKPTNIILSGGDYRACVMDYAFHRLMTGAGIAEQILHQGALGYRAPELATAAKPMPSFKADVYAFGVILMELLTRRSAGDIISGQSGAVDLTDWVRLCDREGRGMDCIDLDIVGGEEHSTAMDELLSISLSCILPVNQRPNIRQVLENLTSIFV
ncbi:PREDICTED: probable inactive receptor kinase At5g10020 [Ipomoea nil]|uniref:probable inactive receptor kinase At5g10020 n=1 Tax=Ipomoea nil TaxID=35883 RepID=UPI000900DA97|nr:PREDICTED: probable inactive receptor kinase At5g10020 [Ipomoea nil]